MLALVGAGLTTFRTTRSGDFFVLGNSNLTHPKFALGFVSFDADSPVYSCDNSPEQTPNGVNWN
jgi:hypothetical protein